MRSPYCRYRQHLPLRSNKIRARMDDVLPYRCLHCNFGACQKKVSTFAQVVFYSSLRLAVSGNDLSCTGRHARTSITACRPRYRKAPIRLVPAKPAPVLRVIQRKSFDHLHAAADRWGGATFSCGNSFSSTATAQCLHSLRLLRHDIQQDSIRGCTPAGVARCNAARCAARPRST